MKTFMDQNIASHGISVEHGEGRLRHAVTPLQMYLLACVFILAVCVLVIRVFYLQIVSGDAYRYISENNSFTEVLVLPVRGDIHDRNGRKLAWNEGDVSDEVPMRKYHAPGFSALLGFIRYPQKDAAGTYFRPRTDGVGGIEELRNDTLAGSGGSFVLEKNAVGETVSERYIERPSDGDDVTLSVDAAVQEYLFESVRTIARERGFRAGSGVVHGRFKRGDHRHGVVSGVQTTTRSPDHSGKIPVGAEDGTDSAIFVHRAISGLYSPGSTIKPFFAVAALRENIVTTDTVITSTGSISVKNPYDPSVRVCVQGLENHTDRSPCTARWRNRQMSYFYYAGGGYRGFNGLGIDRLKTVREPVRIRNPDNRRNIP